MGFSALTFTKEKYRNSLGKEHPMRLALSDVESRFKKLLKRNGEKYFGIKVQLFCVQIQLRGFRTRALGTLFHKMNNDLMTIDNKWIWAVATRFVLAQGTLQATKVNFVFISQNKKKIFNWNRPPLPFLGYMSSSAIWLFQNFSPTTYRPPLPSRLLTRYLKPSKSTTNQFYYLFTEILQAKPTYC